MKKQLDVLLEVSEEEKRRKQSQFQMVWSRLKTNKLAMFGLAVIIIVILMTVFAGVIVDPKSVYAQDVYNKLKPPSAEHLFGTDYLGRDVFARMLFGGRMSLTVALAVIVFSLLIGGGLGALAGYYGGAFDIIVMRIIDILMAVPAMLLCICVVAVLGSGMVNLCVAIVIGYLPPFALIVRSSVMSIRHSEYVEAAHSVGMKSSRIILRHIIPNVVGPIIVQCTLNIGGVILTAASLSFLGLGATPPTPEWGAILNEGKPYLSNAPHLCIIAGAVIALVVACLNFLGDGLRDAIDPRLK